VCVQTSLAVNMTFMELYVQMSPITMMNGSVVVTTVLTLRSYVNVSAYRHSMISNIFGVFIDAGFVVDNSSIGVN